MVGGGGGGSGVKLDVGLISTNERLLHIAGLKTRSCKAFSTFPALSRLFLRAYFEIAAA